jgi:hypothetical protein
MFLLLRIVIWFLWAIFQDSSCYDHADWGTMLHWVVEWQFETMSPLYQRCCSQLCFFCFFFAFFVHLVSKLDWILCSILLPCLMSYPGYITPSTLESF